MSSLSNTWQYVTQRPRKNEVLTRLMLVEHNEHQDPYTRALKKHQVIDGNPRLLHHQTGIGTFTAWPARSCSCPQKAGKHTQVPSTSTSRLPATGSIASTHLNSIRSATSPMTWWNPLVGRAETPPHPHFRRSTSSIQPPAPTTLLVEQKPDAVALRLPHRGKQITLPRRHQHPQFPTSPCCCISIQTRIKKKREALPWKPRQQRSDRTSLSGQKTLGPPEPQQDALHRFLPGRSPHAKRRARAPERWTGFLAVFCISVPPVRR
ncbi:hypothetical protein V8C26DRAFT_112355 [Trichoderma gracile]